MKCILPLEGETQTLQTKSEQVHLVANFCLKVKGGSKHLKSEVTKMATFRVTIEIGPMDQSRFEQIEALVDTGATYTVVPRDVLERLGIMPQFRRRFRLADGRVVELDMAVVAIRLEGQTLPTICVFGEEGMDALLGAVTLEEFGLGVDPVNQRLVPIELLLVGFGIA
jgi:aspartyl protease family protein